jgi:hypothetical protein
MEPLLGSSHHPHYDTTSCAGRLDAIRENEEASCFMGTGLLHRNARVVERKTLKRIMPSASDVIANFAHAIHLQVRGAPVHHLSALLCKRQ